MDWISVIIVLLIIGIVADGLRRVRKSRRENLPVSRRAQELDDEDIKVSSSEFPSGGARVAKRREETEAENLNSTVKQSYATSKVTVGAPRKEPEQTSLNLEEVVPMLMDSLDEDELEDKDSREPALGAMDDIESALDDNAHEQVSARQKATQTASRTTNKVNKEEKKPATNEQKRSSTSPAGSDKSKDEVSEVLVVSVMARKGERFDGEELLAVLMDLKMKFGAMDIFHRHQDDEGEGAVYFSLANMVVPGTFNLAEMKQFSTPGVSLFMQLPLEAVEDSVRAFDFFATAARTLATRLSGELKDENRSVMTSQTFEHYRQRVLEFERRRKLQH